jgi:hypothetical protein
MKTITKKTPDVIPEKTYSIENLVRMIPKSDKGEHFSKLEERITTTVSKEKLETLYHVDGLTFRDVNDYVDKVVGPGYYLEGTKSLIKVAEEWFDNIKLKRLLEEGLKDIFISGAGNCWYELGYNKDGTDIPSVKILNPKLMDYIREKSSNLNVLLDDNGDPIGFRRAKGNYNSDTVWKKDTIEFDGKPVWSSNSEDGRDRIAHFKLFGLGESYLGHSPVETIYKQAIIRLNLEDNAGEAGYRSGGIVATVGAPPSMPSMRPTPESIDKVATDLQNVDIQAVFAFPEGIKVERFPSPDMTGRAELLVYFAGIQSLGMGIPITRHLLPGSKISMSSSNDKQDTDYEQRIISMQDRLSEQIREKLLFRMLLARGLVKEYKDVPKINFRITTSSILKDSIDMLSRLGRRDMVRRDPLLEKYIRDELGLPTEFLDREIIQWRANPDMVPEAGGTGGKNIDTAQPPVNTDPQAPKPQSQTQPPQSPNVPNPSDIVSSKNKKK